MHSRFLLLMLVLISTGGCGDKIDAQENDTAPSEIATPGEIAAPTDIRTPGKPEREKPKALEEQETDVELRSPVGLD